MLAAAVVVRDEDDSEHSQEPKISPATVLVDADCPHKLYTQPLI